MDDTTTQTKSAGAKSVGTKSVGASAPAGEALVLVEVEDRIQTIRINRPGKKNALTRDMYSAMAAALTGADADPGIRATIITGTGDAFTAGNDLADFMNAPPSDPSSPVGRFLEAIATARKPVIAAVNGVAVGIGTTMLLHCDLAYAGQSAVFQMPFVDLGLVPEAGSSLLVPAMVGHRRAAELLMLGDRFSTDVAAELGFVNKVVADADLQETARAAALALAAKAPEALRQTKALLKGSGQAVADRMHEEFKLFAERLRSPELKESIMAFMQKRKPDFSRFE